MSSNTGVIQSNMFEADRLQDEEELIVQIDVWFQFSIFGSGLKQS